ncbi:hypothetical protein ACWD25_32640 [Streptomyces sp. NPDC002920]
MPRSRPSRLRAARPVRRHRSSARREPGLPRASSTLAAAVVLLEHRRLWPGAVAQALRQWSRHARRPGLALSGGCGCPLCDPLSSTEERAVLELALRALPPRPARELRLLVQPLDELFLSRSSPDPFAPSDEGWWTRRCWG